MSKKLLLILITPLSVFTLLNSCSNDGSNEAIVRATTAEFNNLRIAALESSMQNFQFDASQFGVFTSQRGAQLIIDGSCLMKNGNPISGNVDVQIQEFYEKGAMLTANKPTMGKLPNDDLAVLISGGEFYINATHQGDQLQLSCAMQLVVPVDNTGGADNEMLLLCEGGWDNDCDGVCVNALIWEEPPSGNENLNIVNADLGLMYSASFSSFGWTNIDKFYTDPRPKTTLLVNVPEGFDNTNSAVYLSYDGEPNALAYLDTYNTASGLFSEHYGQIPIGLDCHVIFVSEADGQWLYAIKDVTIADGDVISIVDNDLQTTNAEALEALLNDLP